MGKLTTREMMLFSVLGAMTFAAKYAMAFLPNIEPVSLMVMVFAVVFGKKSVYPIYLYVGLEILFYGLGIWNICYLYVWPLLGLAAWMMRSMDHPLGWAMLSGTFGLLFGLLCSIVDLFIGGPYFALSKIISAIPFDLLHCAGNFAIALVLFKPVRQLVEKKYQEILVK